MVDRKQMSLAFKFAASLKKDDEKRKRADKKKKEPIRTFAPKKKAILKGESYSTEFHEREYIVEKAGYLCPRNKIIPVDRLDSTNYNLSYCEHLNLTCSEISSFLKDTEKFMNFVEFPRLIDFVVEG